MEWMLQVADEIDDALGVIRFAWVGMHARIGVFVRHLGAANP